MGAIFDCPQAPSRHRLDVDAYYKMAEAGILTREDRVELIDGEIIDLNPIGSPHASIAKRLNQLFARAAADGIVLVSVQGPFAARRRQRTTARPDAAAAARRRLSGEPSGRGRRPASGRNLRQLIGL